MATRIAHGGMVLLLCAATAACNTASAPGNGQADARRPANAVASAPLAASNDALARAQRPPNAAGAIIVGSTGPIGGTLKAGQAIDGTGIVLGTGDSVDVLVDGQTQHFSGPGRFVPGQATASAPALTLLLDQAGKPHPVTASIRREIRPDLKPSGPPAVKVVPAPVITISDPAMTMTTPRPRVARPGEIMILPEAAAAIGHSARRPPVVRHAEPTGTPVN